MVLAHICLALLHLSANKVACSGGNSQGKYWFISWHLRSEGSDGKGPGPQQFLQGGVPDD